MIVELFKNKAGELVYVNTSHIVTVKVMLGTPDGTNQITVAMDNGDTFSVIEDVLPDGELGPDGLRVLSKIAPEEFTEKFLRINTLRARRGLANE